MSPFTSPDITTGKRGGESFTHPGISQNSVLLCFVHYNVLYFSKKFFETYVLNSIVLSELKYLPGLNCVNIEIYM